MFGEKRCDTVAHPTTDHEYAALWITQHVADPVELGWCDTLDQFRIERLNPAYVRGQCGTIINCAALAQIDWRLLALLEFTDKLLLKFLKSCKTQFADKTRNGGRGNMRALRQVVDGFKPCEGIVCQQDRGQFAFCRREMSVKFFNSLPDLHRMDLGFPCIV